MSIKYLLTRSTAAFALISGLLVLPAENAGAAAYQDAVLALNPSYYYQLNETSTAGGVIDSTGVLEVVSWIEDTFAVTVPDADILPDNLDSIARIVCYVTGCVGA